LYAFLAADSNIRQKVCDSKRRKKENSETLLPVTLNPFSSVAPGKLAQSGQ
jgi:hypothetical protein